MLKAACNLEGEVGMLAKRTVVLCRPQGGLNDLLNQIFACYSYSKQYGRVTYVDCNYKYAYNFFDSFGKYFISQDKDLILDYKPGMLSDLKTVFPQELNPKTIDTYKVARVQWQPSPSSPRLHFFCMQDGDPPTTGAEAWQRRLNLDFSSAYEHDILLHHASGGGKRSFELMKYIKLQPELKKELAERLSVLGSSFSALHIRNTDYKSNYKLALQNFREKCAGPYFIASDSAKVIDFASRTLGPENFFTFSTAISENGFPVHIKKRSNQYLVNKSAILDLLTLAWSKSLHCAKIQNSWSGGVGVSGYSQLAMDLNKNKKVLENLCS